LSRLNAANPIAGLTLPDGAPLLQGRLEPQGRFTYWEMLVAEYLAHSKSKSGRIDTVADHLKSVAARAAEYASAFGAADEARLVGLLHDLGKYGEYR
jgi:hypothetical protein